MIYTKARKRFLNGKGAFGIKLVRLIVTNAILLHSFVINRNNIINK